jgi:hypothetical protein
MQMQIADGDGELYHASKPHSQKIKITETKKKKSGKKYRCISDHGSFRNNNPILMCDYDYDMICVMRS